MRTALYIRASSRDQIQHGVSIPDQLARLRAEARAAGETIVAEFVDQARSGTSAAKRADYQRMLAAARRGELSRIRAEGVDRGHRNDAERRAFEAEMAALHVHIIIEDLLFCPLTDLGLIQSLPEQPTYRLVAGYHPDLPDALIAFAVYELLRVAKRQTISFSDLAYAPRSPGRVFRLDEDALLTRLQRINEITNGQAYYSDQAGIRQVAWPNLKDESTSNMLLARAFTGEMHHV